MPFPIEGLTNSGIPYHFNAFSQLPLEVRFIELNEFKCSFAEAGVNDRILNRVSKRTRALREEKNQILLETPISFNSNRDFLLPSGFYQNARNEGNNNKTVNEHVLSIQSRKTLYTIQAGNSPESKK